MPSASLATTRTVPRAHPELRITTLLPFPLSHPGGVSTFVGSLADALDRQFCARPTLIAPDRFRGRPGQRVSQLALAVQQFIELRRICADVVHTHQHPVLLASALAYQATSPRPVRVVHTIHVDPPERWPDWKRRLVGRLLARCSTVTSVSEHSARHLIDISMPTPRCVQVIYGGAAVKLRDHADAAVGAFRAVHGLQEADNILCMMGPLNFRRKVEGVCRLIEAMPLVRDALPNTKLLLVGDGELRAVVHSAVARAGVADSVILTGFLGDVSIPLTLADVYCQITLQDACPLSLLEAMRARKPVVATRVGGIPELVSDQVDGLLVEPEPTAIAQAVLALLGDPSRAARLADAAAVTASRRFTWERVAAEFAPIYGLATTPV